MLRRSGGEHTGRSSAVDEHLLCAALTAAGGEYHGFCMYLFKPLAADNDDAKALVELLDPRHKGAQADIYILFVKRFHEALDILGAG